MSVTICTFLAVTFWPRVRVPLHSLPPRFGGRRAFALMLEPEVALRELVALEGGRRDVQVGGLGPGVFDCPESSSGYLFGFSLSLPPFGPGPPALQLRDEGVLSEISEKYFGDDVTS